MDWMLMPLRRYAEFDGRSRRREYWMFYLFTLLLGMAFGLIVGIIALATYSLGMSETAMMTIILPFYFIGGLLSLALIIPSLAVSIRRMHDQDKSGWWILIALVPFVGGIVLLVFLCLDGTPGPNRFGPDPKAGERSGGTFA